MIDRGLGRRGPIALLAAALAVVAIGCALPAGSPSGSGRASQAASAEASAIAAASPSSTPTRRPTTTAAAATPVAGATPGDGLVIDAHLLEILPSIVDGVAMEPDTATAATLVGEPDLAASASAIAIGRYIRAGDSTDDDIAVASVIRLRPGVFSEPFFAAWRRDFDASACEAAGGVAGTEAEVAIASFAVHTAACVEGATTYHLRLDGDVLLSILGAGPSRLGEHVVAALQP